MLYAVQSRLAERVWKHVSILFVFYESFIPYCMLCEKSTSVPSAIFPGFGVGRPTSKAREKRPGWRGMHCGEGNNERKWKVCTKQYDIYHLDLFYSDQFPFKCYSTACQTEDFLCACISLRRLKPAVRTHPHTFYPHCRYHHHRHANLPHTTDAARC